MSNYESVDDHSAPNWRNRCTKFISESSFAGALSTFATKSWIIRIFWAVVLLTSVVGFITVTTLNAKMLLDDPISTSITLTRERELNFPAVTICNLNFLNVTTLNSAGNTIQADLTQLFDDVLEKSNVSNCKVHANRLAMNTGYNISWGELTTLATNDFSQLLRPCTYDGDVCTINDFKPINTIAGRCVTFNGQNTRKTSGTGIRKGLRLQFLSDPEDGLEGFSVFRDYGYRVIVHNSDEPPRP